MERSIITTGNLLVEKERVLKMPLRPLNERYPHRPAISVLHPCFVVFKSSKKFQDFCTLRLRSSAKLPERISAASQAGVPSRRTGRNTVYNARRRVPSPKTKEEAVFSKRGFIRFSAAALAPFNSYQ